MEDIARRTYPLEGIERENIKITDIKVTPLSYVDPKRNLWRSGKICVWKTEGGRGNVTTLKSITANQSGKVIDMSGEEWSF